MTELPVRGLTNLGLSDVRQLDSRQPDLGRVNLDRANLDQADPGQTDSGPADRAARLLIRVTAVTVEETTSIQVPIDEYRNSQPDPLHAGAAEQLQHLAAHHPDAISLLTRLCEREAMIGVTRVVPIALDRYGIILRIERIRDHRDVRLPFARRIDTGAQAADEIRHLLARATHRRPCGR
jgi:uncharacterized protein DUF2470